MANEGKREREILLRLRATRKMHFAQGGPPGFTSGNETLLLKIKLQLQMGHTVAVPAAKSDRKVAPLVKVIRS